MQDYSYYPGTQRLQKIEKDGQLFESYTWTDNGELAQKTDIDGNKEIYSWQHGKMTRVEFQGGTNDEIVVNYSYDHTGTLVRRTVYANEDDEQYNITDNDIQYLVDWKNPTGYSQVLAERDAVSGVITRTYTYADQIKQQTNNNEPSENLLTDALGSIRTQKSKTSTTTKNYTAFGSSLTPQTQTTPYAFTGQRKDELTNQQYHRARWLSTSTGSWSSGDPIFDYPENSGNERNYASCSPQNNTDVSGAFSFAEVSVTQLIMEIVVDAQIQSGLTMLTQTFVKISNFEPTVLFLPLIVNLLDWLSFDERAEKISNILSGAEDIESLDFQVVEDLVNDIIVAFTTIFYAVLVISWIMFTIRILRAILGDL